MGGQHVSIHRSSHVERPSTTPALESNTSQPKQRKKKQRPAKPGSKKWQKEKKEREMMEKLMRESKHQKQDTSQWSNMIRSNSYDGFPTMTRNALNRHANYINNKNKNNRSSPSMRIHGSTRSHMSDEE